ncbi:hypothetical protein [Ralstonia sp. A12]|uniref:hypothetical protein n=1 Tax=Ralstonia sp. A12 TaxID=1217052 RepID=UPI0012ED26A2|nr:hypothetical protein [Ralstonia sp. A12]
MMTLLARWLMGLGAVVAIAGLFVTLYVGERRASGRDGRTLEHGKDAAEGSSSADLS